MFEFIHVKEDLNVNLRLKLVVEDKNYTNYKVFC